MVRERGLGTEGVGGDASGMVGEAERGGVSSVNLDCLIRRAVRVITKINAVAKVHFYAGQSGARAIRRSGGVSVVIDGRFGVSVICAKELIYVGKEAVVGAVKLI